LENLSTKIIQGVPVIYYLLFTILSVQVLLDDGKHHSRCVEGAVWCHVVVQSLIV